MSFRYHRSIQPDFVAPKVMQSRFDDQSQKASSDAWIRKAEIELADAKKVETCLSDGFAAMDEELRELRAPLMTKYSVSDDTFKTRSM